ncbi:putative MFS family arabinose efflux permease [Paraburkholderia sp. BL23I1N1]|uniref:MFS transporter n=1 Tax=Paraburkholderia sp. BL23I1N1 TaxID=1938802 RepID=UPI000E718C47|nr:MFS transporter [Paraburkholderia sp. BL23I1N1]RKE37562.1 putative MFS family arabinose efflux permease [Paraburkholderia sp. BL23I1N1]
MTHATVAPDRAARLIHVLFVIQLVSMGAMEMSGPFWPIHLKALSTSSFEFGFAGVAVYVGPMLGIMLTSAFWGRVGDRTGHKLMMIRALLGLSLTQLALAFAADVWTILALRFVQGACAGYIAPAQTYGVSIESPLRRARLFAYLQVSTNLGSLAGAVSGGLILDHATFFWINIVAAVLCVCCVAAVALILPDVSVSKRVAATDPGGGTAAASGARFSWRSPPIPGLLGVVGILLVSRTITQTPFSLYVSSMFGVGNWVVGLCYGMLSLGFVVSASLWARYFEHRTLPDALRRMTFIALACAGLTLAAGLTRNVGVFTAIHFVWGVLLGATTPVLMSLISRAADGLYQGYVLGIAQSTTQFSSIAGIAMGGWLSDSVGLQYTYFFVAVSYVLAMVVILALRRERGAVARPQISPGQ